MFVSFNLGTCTLAIVMVEDFPNRASLPGGPKSGPLSDFSTYANIFEIAENLVHGCVQRRGEVGWQPTGKQNLNRFLNLLLTSRRIIHLNWETSFVSLTSLQTCIFVEVVGCV